MGRARPCYRWPVPHDKERDSARDRLSEVLGREAYNRLVGSIPATRQRGRLRFWQEQLLQRAASAGVAISSASELLRVLDGATLLHAPSVPWTREVFLREIEAFPLGGFPLDETPAEWMAAAWEISRVREEISGEMARTVSKIGELAYTDEYLRYLSGSLSVPRQVELFLYIRERCVTREAEFRIGFERVFPECVPFLPPPLTHQQLLDELGLTEEEYQLSTRGDQLPPAPGNSEQPTKEDIPF
jgi:hypothetical protein